MNQQLLIILGIGLLALGTYGIRFAGFHLGAKFIFSENTKSYCQTAQLFCSVRLLSRRHFLKAKILQVSRVYSVLG